MFHSMTFIYTQQCHLDNTMGFYYYMEMCSRNSNTNNDIYCHSTIEFMI